MRQDRRDGQVTEAMLLTYGAHYTFLEVLMSSATPRHRVPAGVTALRVLDLLAASPRGRGVSDIAESLGLDPGQAHRLLRHLVEDGWVAQTEARGRYVITGRLLSIAGTLLGHLELRECAMPILEAVQTRIRETVALAELRGDRLICVARVRAEQHVTVGTQIGDVIPFDGTAVGTAVRAAQRRRTLAIRKGLPLQPRIAAGQPTLEQGYALSDRTHFPEVRAVSAAVLDLEGRPVGAVFIVAPASRVSRADMRGLGQVCTRAAIDVSKALGHREPSGGWPT